MVDGFVEQVDQQNLQFKSDVRLHEVPLFHTEHTEKILSSCLGPHLAVGRTAKQPREWGRASANPFPL